MISRKKFKIIPVILMAILVSYVWSWFPVTERFNVQVSDEGNIGVRIALITDLHSCYYGVGQKSLIKRIDEEFPDIIILGGDIFDDKLSDDNAKILFSIKSLYK